MAEKKPDTVKLGHEWVVEVDSKVDQVVFLNPAGREYAVRPKKKGTKTIARLVLNVAGDWSAADGAFTATVK